MISQICVIQEMASRVFSCANSSPNCKNPQFREKSKANPPTGEAGR